MKIKKSQVFQHRWPKNTNKQCQKGHALVMHKLQYFDLKQININFDNTMKQFCCKFNDKPC